MPAPDLYPIPLATLIDRMERELAAGGPLYFLRRRDWWVPDPALDLSWDHFGQRCATPAGPASGPQTQLAQNLVLSWLAGGRFMELKTVQVLDELVIPRPCIDVPHIGYNVEWSQELRVRQSAREYVKGWWLLHMLAGPRGPGLWPNGPETIFDISLGYDLAGIRADSVRGYLDAMRDASGLLGALRDELPASQAAWAATPCPPKISDTITLSTFHGCPAAEIEAIATQTLEWGFHTIVKLNPTLHGFDHVRQTMDHMGYDYIGIDAHAFEKDLQWEQLREMIPRLKARAAALGLGFGVKFTNTLVCQSDEPNAGRGFGEGEMYLSGPPLHVLAFTLAARFRAEIDGEIPVTFSAGIDAKNFAECVEAGLGPVTSCSDLLKGRGYARMKKQLTGLESRMKALGARDLQGLRAASDPAAHLRQRAAGLRDEARYHRSANKKAPHKIDSHLELLDCLTCDKCVPVCPNAANFTFPVPRGEHTPGRLAWRGGDFALSEGEPLLVEKRHQIGNTADACNLCGQCDVWCPEYDGPYLVKPTLFLSERSFSDHPGRDGFVLSTDRRALRWRREGVTYRYAAGPDGARFETPGGAVQLRDDAPVATEGDGEVDLRLAVTMRLFLEAFQDTGETWLPPIARGG